MNFLQKKNNNRLDFIIAGAEKAGTSYLSKVLCSSPDIVMPEHEVRHFRDPFYPDRERLDDLLQNKNGEKVGIKHPSYLGRAEVPERIHKHSPDMKLIFVLRNPVERAISSYLHYIRHGQIPLLHPNEGFLRMVEERDRHPKYRDILEFGLYHKYIQMYQFHFKSDNLLILEYEEFLNGAVDMSPVTSFLAIKPIANPPASRINEGTRNWHSCQVDFIRAIAFNRYDEGLNIIGRHDQPYLDSFDQNLPQLRRALANDPIVIDKNARAALQSFYENDIKALRKADLLQPVNW